MPTALTSSASARTVNESISSTRGATHGRKTRMRRRGRAKGSVDSDEEIEREARTDSESEDDDISSLDSSSDSDTEPASEDVAPNHHPRVVTPSTSQSPEEVPSLDKDAAVEVNGHSASFFGGTGNWSDMVAAENANGPAELPVIDFSELNHQAFPSSRKAKRIPRRQRSSNPSLSRSPPPPQSDEHEQEAEESSTPHRESVSGSFPRRPPGQTARQAYQQRLETDPSYVPTVGEFWGHDDRLLDKNLRSLSGWWRGRWQGGSRGRGGSVRGRGFPGPGFAQSDSAELGAEAELPPVDRAWTHDGFEEMKRNDERRRTNQQHQAQPQPAFRGLGGARGRGAPVTVRGGRGGRGGFSPSFRTRGISPSLPPGRVWYKQKPEFMWTKQQDSFLYHEPASRPRPGQVGSVRVKLPGGQSQPIRVLLHHTSEASSSAPAVSSFTSLPGSDYERAPMVRLPKRAGKEKAVEDASKADKRTVLAAEEPSIDEVFTVRPRLVTPKLIPLPAPSTNTKVEPPISQSIGAETASSSMSIDPTVQQKLEQVSLEPQKSDPARWAQTEEAVLRHPTGTQNVGEEPLQGSSDSRPPLLPLQTSFSPPQGSPAYGSPYSYAPALPPGVAVNAVGVPYEVATGRPIYLPPPSMYTPPTIMHSVPPAVPFVPGHIHHHSAVSSTDFMSPGTPPINGYVDYSSGPPLFSFPRQSSRVEIRAPGNSEKQASATLGGRHSSGLRTSAVAFEPQRSSDSVTTEYFPPYPPEAEHTADAGSSGENPSQQVSEPMMGYMPYAQYYYPEQYGYNPYMDMSQVGQYEMYPQEHMPHGTVYYQ